MTLERILAIIAALAPATGIDHAALAGELAGVASRIIASEKERSGKTTQEIFADAGLTLDEAEAKLLEDSAKGE